MVSNTKIFDFQLEPVRAMDLKTILKERIGSGYETGELITEKTHSNLEVPKSNLMLFHELEQRAKKMKIGSVLTEEEIHKHQPALVVPPINTADNVVIDDFELKGGTVVTVDSVFDREALAPIVAEQSKQMTAKSLFDDTEPLGTLSTFGVRDFREEALELPSGWGNFLGRQPDPCSTIDKVRIRAKRKAKAKVANKSKTKNRK